MPSRAKTRGHEDPKLEADRVVRELSKIAFGNMADFVTLDSNGDIAEIDFEKAREVGAMSGWLVARSVGGKMQGPL